MLNSPDIYKGKLLGDSSATSFKLNQPNPRWLVSPAYDLLLISNVAWPICAFFMAWVLNAFFSSAIEYYIFYILVIPHRFITPFLVCLEGHRRPERQRAFFSVFLFVAVGYSLLWFSLPDIAILLLIRYVWNCFHGASQIFGISRIYSTAAKSMEGQDRLGSYLYRSFFTYSTCRLIHLDAYERRFGSGLLVSSSWNWKTPLSHLDYLFLFIPIFLLAREFYNFRRERLGKLVYVCSNCVLYSALLVATHFSELGYPSLAYWAAGLALSTALTHSTEYLAIVSWAKDRRWRGASMPVRAVFEQWAMSLGIGISSLAVLANLLEGSYAKLWIFVATLASFFHYAFDGMIWKRPVLFSQKIQVQERDEPSLRGNLALAK